MYQQVILMCLIWKTPLMGYISILCCVIRHIHIVIEIKKAFVISNEFYLLEAPATHDKVARRISSIVKFQHLYQSHAIVMV